MDQIDISLINQIALLELRLQEHNLGDTMFKNLEKIKQVLKEKGFEYYLPLNEKYTETRSDVQANIVGQISDNMLITKIIKPIIYYNDIIIQKGIVIVEKT